MSVTYRQYIYRNIEKILKRDMSGTLRHIPFLLFVIIEKRLQPSAAVLRGEFMKKFNLYQMKYEWGNFI